MISIRPADERGHYDYGWLDTRHTFSFNEYFDRQHMGFRHLRVINEDRVAPGEGFPTHPHSDMEIITYVLEGALKHRDSMGNGSVIRPGEIQKMSAGTGITHSEYNPSKSHPVHLLQIWIKPERPGLQPSYEQISLNPSDIQGRLRLVASRSGGRGIVTIYQDVSLFAGALKERERIEYVLTADRHAWIQIARGSVELNGQRLNAGDGAAVSDESNLRFDGGSAAEFLLFDMS